MGTLFWDMLIPLLTEEEITNKPLVGVKPRADGAVQNVGQRADVRGAARTQETGNCSH